MRVAIVYDRINKWGGAERVLLTLREMFPDADLYTSVYNPKNAKWARQYKSVQTSFLQKIPGMSLHHDILAPFMPLAFESFNFNSYDLVISVTSEAAKGIITSSNTYHICYCLTPTRYLWSGYKDYFRNPLLRYSSKPVVRYLKRWEKISAQRPDMMVAISTTVKRRILKYYKRDTSIIFPPLDQRLAERLKMARKERKDYFLVVSRLVPYKKVDLAIKSFNANRLPLVVVGTGSEEVKLKRMAKKNIQFVGKVSEASLADYYSQARALIFPQKEDFGLAAIEAQAAGTPVIAYKRGGALDIITDGKDGIFFRHQSVKSLLEAINRFHSIKFDRNAIIGNTTRFSAVNFKKEFDTLIQNARK